MEKVGRHCSNTRGVGLDGHVRWTFHIMGCQQGSCSAMEAVSLNHQKINCHIAPGITSLTHMSA